MSRTTSEERTKQQRYESCRNSCPAEKAPFLLFLVQERSRPRPAWQLELEAIGQQSALGLGLPEASVLILALRRSRSDRTSSTKTATAVIIHNNDNNDNNNPSFTYISELLRQLVVRAPHASVLLPERNLRDSHSRIIIPDRRHTHNSRRQRCSKAESHRDKKQSSVQNRPVVRKIIDHALSRFHHGFDLDDVYLPDTPP